MNDAQLSKFTVIYTCEQKLSLYREVLMLPVLTAGSRLVIPMSFKQGKIIIAVCEGEVSMLNALGDRIIERNSS